DRSVRREVFLFESGGEQLFASLYASARPSRPAGVVVCPSWGIEANRMFGLVHGLVHRAAELGGAGLVFHYPGYGDSTGRLASVTMEDLAAAAIDATADASRREPGLEWGFAGVRLGAAVAALARRTARVRQLLLVQPALDPASYFEEVLAKRRRATLGRDGATRFAFGYPVPEALLRVGPSITSSVSSELGSLDGENGLVVHYRTPAASWPGLERFDRITVAGRWRFGLKDYPALAGGALAALEKLMGQMP
ncbi:MAG: hypothetical protein ACJ8DJ_07445, partial [Gemmatimonadales bacterium]